MWVPSVLLVFPRLFCCYEFSSTQFEKKYDPIQQKERFERGSEIDRFDLQDDCCSRTTKQTARKRRDTKDPSGP